MIISIWLILVLIAGAGFWFFYKKNKFKLQSPTVKKKNKQTKYSLTNLDQMLNHVTQKETDKEEINMKNELSVSVNKQKNEEIAEPKQKEKVSFDIKNGIIASIILKKKENL